MSTKRLEELQEEGVDVSGILFDGEAMPLGGAGNTPEAVRSTSREIRQKE